MQVDKGFSSLEDQRKRSRKVTGSLAKNK